MELDFIPLLSGCNFMSTGENYFRPVQKINNIDNILFVFTDFSVCFHLRKTHASQYIKYKLDETQFHRLYNDVKSRTYFGTYIIS